MFEINPFELWQGDCFALMDQIPEHSVDLIIADLPYGQTKRNKWDQKLPLNDYVPHPKNGTPLDFEAFQLYCFHSGISSKKADLYYMQQKKRGLWSHLRRVLKENGAVVMFANGMYTAELMKSNRDMWRYNLIWEKTQPTGFQNAERMPLRSHEDMCVFYKHPPVYHPQKTTGHVRKISKADHQHNRQSLNYNDIGCSSYDSTERYPKSIWTYPKDSRKTALHPTQKPVALFEELIKTYSDVGDVVFDPCSGSMTTSVAALHTGRKSICIEKNRTYFDRGVYRVLKEYVEI